MSFLSTVVYVSKSSSPQQGRFCLATAAVAVFQPLQNQLHHAAPQRPQLLLSSAHLSEAFPLHGAPPPRVCFNDSNLFPIFTSQGGSNCLQKLLLPWYLRIPFLLSQLPTIYQMQKEEFSCKKKWRTKQSESYFTQNEFGKLRFNIVN